MTPAPTAQELFDKIVNHLRTQGVASFGPHGKPNEDGTPNGDKCCLYRGPDDTKCAVGFLIPDAEYHADQEGEGILTLMDKPDLAGASLLALHQHTDLLSALQNAHDHSMPRATDTAFDARRNNRTPGHFETRLRSVAANFGLTYTPITPEGSPAWSTSTSRA